MKWIAFLLFIFATGCGLPFMAARGGYDKLAGRPADPNGRGCDYKDRIYNDPNPNLISLLVLQPIFDPIPGALVPSYCSDTTTCNAGEAKPVRYYKDQPMPQACITYQDLLNQQAAYIQEEEEKKRKEAMEQLLKESPVQSEQGLRNDIELVNKLTPTQRAALRDAVNNVILTADEQKSLASIDQNQWHAITQLAAFSKWLNEKIQDAQAQAEAQQEQTEREEDRLRLSIYQSLTTEAAERQAAAAEWQAAAAWRQQQCLRNISTGLGCY